MIIPGLILLPHGLLAKIAICPGGRGRRKATPLTIETSLTAGTATVVVRGDLDIATTPVLVQHLARILEQRPQRLVFDLSQAGFLDVAAARLIAGTARSLPEGHRPVIRGAGPAARRILTLTGLDACCDMTE